MTGAVARVEGRRHVRVHIPGLLGLIEAGVVRIDEHRIRVTSVEKPGRRTEIRSRHATRANLEGQRVGQPIAGKRDDFRRVQAIVGPGIAARVRPHAEVLDLGQVLPVDLRTDAESAAAHIGHFKRALGRLVASPRVGSRSVEPHAPLRKRHSITGADRYPTIAGHVRLEHRIPSGFPLSRAVLDVLLAKLEALGHDLWLMKQRVDDLLGLARRFLCARAGSGEGKKQCRCRDSRSHQPGSTHHACHADRVTFDGRDRHRANCPGSGVTVELDCHMTLETLQTVICRMYDHVDCS